MSKVGKLRVLDLKNQDGEHGAYAIQCPGCGNWHAFDSRWRFNGDFEKPTFTPSMLVNQHKPESRCHSFVTDGKIQFLSDCHHKYAGQTLDLEGID
jgi:hypothetical protein